MCVFSQGSITLLEWTYFGSTQNHGVWKEVGYPPIKLYIYTYLFSSTKKKKKQEDMPVTQSFKKISAHFLSVHIPNKKHKLPS